MGDFGFYFKIGWNHIMNWEALDHILFITALAAIYMLKDWRQVLILVTAFTIGHAITLALSTLRIVEVASSWVEFLIPCTIIFTAISNIFLKTFTHREIRINYFLALFFGLIHGLAFANTLRMIMAEDQSFALAMFSFSVGLELGQILVVFLVLLLAQLVIDIFNAPRIIWVIVVSGVVFCLALSMAIDRIPWKQNTLLANKLLKPLLHFSFVQNKNRYTHEESFLVFCSSRFTYCWSCTKHSKQSRLQPCE